MSATHAAARLAHTFTYRVDEDATEVHRADVSLPGSIKDLPEAIQAALYRDAIRNLTIRVQNPMRKFSKRNPKATQEQKSKFAQDCFDEALLGTRRAVVTRVEVVEVVKAVDVDVTALGFTKEQVAKMAAEPEKYNLVNVPEEFKKYLNS